MVFHTLVSLTFPVGSFGHRSFCISRCVFFYKQRIGHICEHKCGQSSACKRTHTLRCRKICVQNCQLETLSSLRYETPNWLSVVHVKKQTWSNDNSNNVNWHDAATHDETQRTTDIHTSLNNLLFTCSNWTMWLYSDFLTSCNIRCHLSSNSTKFAAYRDRLHQLRCTALDTITYMTSWVDPTIWRSKILCNTQITRNVLRGFRLSVTKDLFRSLASYSSGITPVVHKQQPWQSFPFFIWQRCIESAAAYERTKWCLSKYTINGNSDYNNQ